MRWNGRGTALAGLAAAALVMQGRAEATRRRVAPTHPPTYPQGDPRIASPGAQQSPVASPDGPPSSSGPSATSGNGADRYDEVGYATWYGEEIGGNRTASGERFDPAAFTAAHRTLPLGSYVEVTSLASGRTILVKVNDRGPGDRGLLIDLSKGAAQALGMNTRGAVRVRRVSPSTDDYIAIRTGRPGASRLDTPPALLAGLKQRLSATPVAAPPRLARPVLDDRNARPVVSGMAGEAVAPVAAPVRPASGPGYYVQVATLSSKPRAQALAKSLGGSAQGAGTLWRVRLGPYASSNQAAQARDGAARRGYGDARVVRGD